MNEEEFSTAPGPLSMFRKIPVQVRWWGYSVLATAFAIEGVLDASDIGVVPERWQGVIIGIAAIFGFTTAVANTDK
jgi:hypothetical protein